MKEDKKLTDIEQEKSMYAICFSTLAICLVLLFLLGNSVSIKPIMTGAVVLKPDMIKEDVIIDYKNISFENISQELALDAILQAERDMQEMQEAGFGIVWINDTLIEAKKYFEGENYTALLADIGKIEDLERRQKARALLIEAQKKIGVSVDYEKVLEKTKTINERKIKAYETNDHIRASELRINDLKATGLNATPVFELLSKAEIEFKEERYEDAITLLAEIEPKINEIKAETTLLRTIYKFGRENIVNFIKKHYIAIIITLIIVVIVFLLSYNRIIVKILDKKIKDMDVEKDVLEELIKKAQVDHYSKGVIPKRTYEIKISKYKERMLEIKRQLPVMQARLEKLAKMKRII